MGVAIDTTHTETYNVIVRIYIYRLASILQSNVIYEADPRDVFNAGPKAVREKIGYVTNNVHTATVKNDRRLTKRLPLNRATGTIHHYLAGRPVRPSAFRLPRLPSIQLALSFSHALSPRLSVSFLSGGLRSMRLHYLTTAL